MSQNKLSERWEEYHSTAIVKGLKAALDDISIERSLDEFEDGHIKLNKLMYVAMAECGLYEDIQHSWHRYGGDLGTQVPSTYSVKPTALDDLPQTTKPSSPEVVDDDQNIWDESDYYKFFNSVKIGDLNSLQEILEADRSTLLEEFYTVYRGDIEEWVDLYLINVRIQEVLHLYKSGDLDSFGKEEYQKFAETLRIFRKELYSHEELAPPSIDKFNVNIEVDENPADLLSEFMDLVDDVYYTLSEHSPDEFAGDLSYQLGMVEEFYHERAWNVVTKVISLNTPHGPNQDALIHGTRTDIERLVDNYQIRMERIESECRAVDLLPEVSEEIEQSSVDPEPGDRLPTRSEFRDSLKGEEA